MSISARLAELNIELPKVAAPLASYVPARKIGDQVATSGQLPLVDGALSITGKVGTEVSVAQATEQARIAALNALAAAAEITGGVDNITEIVKVTVFVASSPDFTGQPAVANGASQLFSEIFGAAGQHIRAAVGVAVLPLDAVVEVELTVQT